MLVRWKNMCVTHNNNEVKMSDRRYFFFICSGSIYRKIPKIPVRGGGGKEGKEKKKGTFKIESINELLKHFGNVFIIHLTVLFVTNEL